MACFKKCLKTCLIPVCPCLACCGDDENKSSDATDAAEECTEPVAAAKSQGEDEGGCCPCCGPGESNSQNDDDAGGCPCCPCCGPSGPSSSAPRAAAPMDSKSAPAPVAAPMDDATSTSPAAAAVATVAPSAPLPMGPMGGNKSGSNSPNNNDKEDDSGPTGIAVIDTGIENRDKRPSGDDKEELVVFVTPEDGYSCNECGKTFDKGTTLWSNRDKNIDVCGSCHKE